MDLNSCLELLIIHNEYIVLGRYKTWTGVIDINASLALYWWSLLYSKSGGIDPAFNLLFKYYILRKEVTSNTPQIKRNNKETETIRARETLTNTHLFI